LPIGARGLASRHGIVSSLVTFVFLLVVWHLSDACAL